MRGWRAWYTHGRRIDSTDTDWAGLPASGMLGVVVYHDPPYRDLVYGGDWYYLDDGEPTCTDTVWGGRVDPPDAPGVELKRGAAIPAWEWRRVETELMDARTWP